MRGAVSAVLLVLAVAAGGCTAGPEPAPEGPPSERGGGDRGAERSGEAVDVIAENTLFVPRTVTVPAGGSVTWTNEDPFAHDVTKEAGPGPDFASETLQEGDTFTQRFDDPGTVEYVCTIHPQQTGTVVVEK
jgi:plastocyanin